MECGILRVSLSMLGLFGALLSGCSGGGGNDSDSNAGSGGKASGDAGASTGGTGNGGKSAGIGGRATAGAAGFAEPDTSRWMVPLQAGRSWDYEIAAIDSSLPITCDGEPTGRVIRAFGNVNNSEQSGFSWIYTTVCSSRLYLVWGDEGTLYAEEVVAKGDTYVSAGESQLTFLVDPTVATSWTSGGTTYTWENVGTVTAATGTYSDCWRRVFGGDHGSSVYCRGIGMVSSDVTDKNYNYSLKLSGLVVP
jgi:hypothetical protein